MMRHRRSWLLWYVTLNRYCTKPFFRMAAVVRYTQSLLYEAVFPHNNGLLKIAAYKVGPGPNVLAAPLLSVGCGNDWRLLYPYDDKPGFYRRSVSGSMQPHQSDVPTFPCSRPPSRKSSRSNTKRRKQAREQTSSEEA